MKLRFGIHEQKPTHVWLNYIGVGLSAASALFYLFVKSNTNSKAANNNTEENSNNSNETAPLIDDITSINEARPAVVNENFIDRQSPRVKQIVGTCLAIFSGIMYGMFFTPELYVIDNYDGASKNGLGNYNYPDSGFKKLV